MPLGRVFQIGVGGGESPSVEVDGKFCLGDLIHMMMETWGEVILTIRTFSKAKNNIILETLNTD